MHAADEDNALALLRVDGGKDLGYTAAQRMTADECRSQIERLDEFVHVLRVLFGRVLAIRPVAVAMPPLVWGEDVKPLAEDGRRSTPTSSRSRKTRAGG